MYRVQVIADPSGQWAGNGVSFDTVAAARTWADDLMWRWMAVRDWRVINAKGVPVANRLDIKMEVV